MKPSQDKERLVTACEVGEDVFWNAIATAYPEIKSGDFPPDIAMEMADKLTQFVTVWLKMNEHDIPKPQVSEIMLHRIEYTYRLHVALLLTDSDKEHIAYCIAQGISEGELCTTIQISPIKEEEVFGYWKINNCPDA